MAKQKTFIYDYWLLLIVTSLLVIGLLMVTSASMVISDRQFHTPFHFLFHQLAYLVIGISLAFIIIRIPLLFWEKISPYLLIMSLFLLFAVLLPGIGKEVNGSIRWVGFGPLGIQVSELTKFCVVIFMAGFLLRREQEVQESFIGFVKPMLILGVIAILLLLEPDFGATAVIILTVLGMLFLGNFLPVFCGQVTLRIPAYLNPLMLTGSVSRGKGVNRKRKSVEVIR